MKVDDNTIERLIEKVESFDKKLTNYEESYTARSRLESENKRLQNELSELKTKLVAPDYRSRTERAVELDSQEANLKIVKKLEYDKGYVAAYAEVTARLGKS